MATPTKPDGSKSLNAKSPRKQQMVPAARPDLGFDKAKVADMWRLFLEFDTDGSGAIDSQELSDMAYELSGGVSVVEAQKLINEAKGVASGNNEITFEEFLRILSKTENGASGGFVRIVRGKGSLAREKKAKLMEQERENTLNKMDGDKMKIGRKNDQLKAESERLAAEGERKNQQNAQWNEQQIQNQAQMAKAVEAESITREAEIQEDKALRAAELAEGGEKKKASLVHAAEVRAQQDQVKEAKITAKQIADEEKERRKQQQLKAESERLKNANKSKEEKVAAFQAAEEQRIIDLENKIKAKDDATSKRVNSKRSEVKRRQTPA
jgi:hypothetical protein